MSEGNSDQSSAVAPPPPPCARESAENKCRSPAPSEHSSADTVDDGAVRASRPAVLQPISCAQDLELQVLLEQFAAKFFVVKFESFTPIFSRGGPLLNSHGELIGMNTAILSPSSQTSTGVGFAIPVDAVVDDVRVILTKIARASRTATMGIAMAPDTTKQRLGDAFPSGVLVLDVAEGGPAASAGVRPSRRDFNGRDFIS